MPLARDPVSNKVEGPTFEVFSDLRVCTHSYMHIHRNRKSNKIESRKERYNLQSSHTHAHGKSHCEARYCPHSKQRTPYSFKQSGAYSVSPGGAGTGLGSEGALSTKRVTGCPTLTVHPPILHGASLAGKSKEGGLAIQLSLVEGLAANPEDVNRIP